MPSKYQLSENSHPESQSTYDTMAISSDGLQTESVQGMSQKDVGATSPQGTVSASALTLDLDKNIDGRVLSVEAM